MGNIDRAASHGRTAFKRNLEATYPDDFMLVGSEAISISDIPKDHVFWKKMSSFVSISYLKIFKTGMSRTKSIKRSCASLLSLVMDITELFSPMTNLYMMGIFTGMIYIISLALSTVILYGGPRKSLKFWGTQQYCVILYL